MPSLQHLLAFVGAALLLAVMPGPGQLFVAGRTLSGGRRVGLLTSLGTALGGCMHVVAGAVGLSALMMASPSAFTIVKVVGGLYLVWIGVQTWRSADEPIDDEAAADAGTALVLRQAAFVEATNPKTAAFFLALIPQFVDPSRGPIAVQFLILGLISIVLNTIVAALTTLVVASMRGRARARPRLLRNLRRGSAVLLAMLGVSLLLAQRTH